MGLQISGLVNNLDTTSIIDQLMQIEANPQTLLKQRLAAVQTDATAYRAINTRFAALQTAADALGTSDTWTATKATSSNSAAVAATAGGAALAGSLTFKVDQLATNHTVISANPTPWASTDTAFGAASIDVTVGGTTSTITINGKNGNPPTLADAVAAINASDAKLSATAVQVAPGKYQLQVSANTSGADASFSLTSAAAGFSTVTQGQNAQLTVGTTGTYTVTSPTNTFAGLMTGTTITVNQAGTTATVTVASDPSAVAAKVKSFVDAANGLLDSISSYTDADSTAAVLKGDSTLRGFANRILDLVSSGVAGTSASMAGIALTKDGHLTFDQTAFTDKLSVDPAAVRDLFTRTQPTAGADGITGTADDVTEPVGLAARIAALAKSASDSTTGTITLLATSQDDQAKGLQDSIDAWDIRLAMRKDSLTRQFTAMTTALQTLQNQSTWLQGQLNSLPGFSQSSSNKS